MLKGLGEIKEALVKKSKETLKDMTTKKQCELCNKNITFYRVSVKGFGDRIVCIPCINEKKLSLKCSDCEIEFVSLLTSMFSLELKTKCDDCLSNEKKCEECNREFERKNRKVIGLEDRTVCTACVQEEKITSKCPDCGEEFVVFLNEDTIVTKCDSCRDLITRFELKYTGGHPDFSKSQKVWLDDRPFGIVAFEKGSPKPLFVLEWNRIKNISTDTTEITKASKGGAGVALIGLLSKRSDLAIMGSAMRTTEKNNFLNITYKNSVMETEVSFEGEAATSASAYFIKQIHRHVKSGQIELRQEDEHITVPDTADQIRKLFNLKEEGILTETEFENKKVALLAEI